MVRLQAISALCNCFSHDGQSKTNKSTLPRIHMFDWRWTRANKQTATEITNSNEMKLKNMKNKQTSLNGKVYTMCYCVRFNCECAMAITDCPSLPTNTDRTKNVEGRNGERRRKRERNTVYSALATSTDTAHRMREMKWTAKETVCTMRCWMREIGFFRSAFCLHIPCDHT